MSTSSIPLPSEEIHTPNPHPARGIYGFALYIFGWIGLIVYLIWAIVPTPILESFGITYVPAKAWVVVVPLGIFLLTILFPLTILFINIFRFQGVFDDIQHIEKDFGDDLFAKMLARICRFSRRYPSTSTSIPTSGQHKWKRVEGSRSSKVFEIQKRLAEYERNVRLVEKNTSDYSVESIMAEQHIQSNTQEFAKLLTRREQETLKIEDKGENTDCYTREIRKYTFPLAQNEQIDYTSSLKDGSSGGETSLSAIDRGFYIEGDIYFDEYRAGTILDLPEDEMTRATADLYGPEDAVEHIEFQLPGQSNEIVSAEEEDVNKTWIEQFGTLDPSRPESRRSCCGCGAHFHCKDPSLPGFVPVELFEKVERPRKTTEQHLCKRCHLLKHHNFLLNVNVCPVDYMKMMEHLKMKEEALILLIVDMTDLPGSIHRQLPHIIGERKPMIVIGNKVDLLPPDARCGYLKRFRQVVESTIEEAGFKHKFNLLHTALVSAKTGYGVEDLITQIHMNWINPRMGARADMYLVGCTNAGKSTLFNSFLQSDLCKVRAVDLVERATTSIWPGTTISLLKFPVMKVSPHRLELRRRRLLANKAWQQKENYMRKLALQETGESKYAVLTGLLQNTYKEREDELQPVSMNELQGIAEPKKDEKKWSLDDHIFAKGNWCYDTPGTVNQDQVLGLFTLSELVKVLPRQLLTPRTAIVKPGNSLIIGGVAVVDLLSTTTGDSALLTVFASGNLPLNVVATRDVDKFLEVNLPKGTLVVPLPDPKRLEKWPKMEGEAFEIVGCTDEIAATDLVLSSIGWVSITSPNGVIIRGRIPTGKGVTTRESLLPYAAELRGKRIPGTPFYSVKPVEFPINVRRQQAILNRRRFKGI
ncbi:unnamed protein product, partial [Mesorhabditis belari]|uniref:G domain-containing protein n=1 Tax=Mesorhabditis belari TaxID=2138241 RepID=A0AAF3EZL6_9BILA